MILRPCAVPRTARQSPAIPDEHRASIEALQIHPGIQLGDLIAVAVEG